MNNLDNSINDITLASGLLDFSEYVKKQTEQSEKAKSTYKTLTEDLRNNFSNPSAILGMETKIIGVVDFIETKDLQKELDYFQKLYDDLKSKSEEVQNAIEQDFLVKDGDNQLVTLNNRNVKIKEFESLAGKEKQAAKIVLMFHSAIKEKERRAEQNRRKKIGAKLRMIREMRGLSQSQVATSLGTNKSLISNYESGEREPTIKNLIKLATTLKISSDWLLDIPVADA